MQRQGANPNDMQPADFICDFSLRPWDGAFPMVEGHRGSLISGDCLTIAYADVILSQRTSIEPGQYTCTMCLESRNEPCWQSPARPEAVICRRCIRQGATRLEKDPDWDWLKPTAETAHAPSHPHR
ncbi:MAG: hypothetical protein AAGB48_06075 [Planctomycetota bacterium]